jgi:hypothetical protein
MMTPPMIGTIVLELSSPVVVVQVFPVNAGRVSRDALKGNEVMTDVSDREPKRMTVFELVGDSVCVDVDVGRLCWFVVCSVIGTKDVEDVSDSASAVDDTDTLLVDSDVPIVAASKVSFAGPVVLSDICWLDCENDTGSVIECIEEVVEEDVASVTLAAGLMDIELSEPSSLDSGCSDLEDVSPVIEDDGSSIVDDVKEDIVVLEERV